MKNKFMRGVVTVFLTWITISKVNSLMTYALSVEGDWREVGLALLGRLIFQDLLLIIQIALIVLVEAYVEKKYAGRKKWANVAVTYIIGYFIVLGVNYAYFFILSFFFTIILPGFGQMVAISLPIYGIVTVVLIVKDAFKQKVKDVEQE
jgi:hypothetical protein